MMPMWWQIYWLNQTDLQNEKKNRQPNQQQKNDETNRKSIEEYKQNKNKYK